MAGTACDIEKRSFQALSEEEKNRVEIAKKNSAARRIKDDAADLVSVLEEEYPKGRFIDKSIITKKIQEIYGKQSKNTELAILIKGMMDANEMLAAYLYEFTLEHVGENQNVGTGIKRVIDKNAPDIKSWMASTKGTKEEYYKKFATYKQVERFLDLKKLPRGTLKVIYREALKHGQFADMEDAGIIRKIKASLLNFDGYLSYLYTPAKRGLKEVSGGFWAMQRAVNTYANRVSNRINRFTSPMKDPKGRTMYKGMNSILNRVEQLAYQESISKTGDFTLQQKYMAVFSRYMSGRIYFNGEEGHPVLKDVNEGELIIYPEWGQVTDEKGNPVKIENSTDTKYAFQNPVLLSEYTPPNRKKGEWNINMDGKRTEQFLNLAKEAREIDDKVFEYMQKEMEAALKTIMDELKLAFPNMPENQLNLIFFQDKTEFDLAGKKVNLLDNMTDEEVVLVNQLKDSFSFSLSDGFVIVNGAKVEKKKNHWPTLFNKDLYVGMLTDMKDSFEAIVKEFGDAVKSKLDSEGNPMSKKDIVRAKTILAEYTSKLNTAESILLRIDDYPVDLQHNQIIALTRDNKYFKRITNAYDLRQARVDTGVYFDYLKNVMTTIERNRLSASLIKSLRLSSQNNSAHMHKAVSKASINLFKVPFHSTDIYRQGFFTRMFPQLSTVEGINSILNWVPYRNKTAQHLNNTFRITASYLTGVLLSGPHTTIQNRLDSYRTVLQFGFKTNEDATKLLEDPDTREKIQSIIAKSGITEFSDFFSKSMINGIVGQEIEAEVSDAILTAMMDYHDAKIKVDKGSRSSKEYNRIKKEFLEKVNGALQSSESIMNAQDYFNTMLPKEDAKTRRARVKQDKRLYFTNKLVQFAIEKEFVFKDAILFSSWSGFKKWKELAKSKVPKGYKNNIAGLYIAYTKMFMGKDFTMSGTEKFIRSLSFVIGATRVANAGLIRDDKEWWNYTDERDIQKVIEAGRIYSEKMNFGLSTQATGEYNYNSLGNLMGKFKYWSQQKFGNDVRLFQEAYTSVKSLESIKKGDLAFFSTSAKLIKRMVKSIRPGGSKVLRIANPEVYALRNFLFGQGLMTLAVDLAVMGLIPAGSMARKFIYGATGIPGLRGWSSDLITLTFSLPTMIIASLLGADFDDEEDDRTLKYLLRKTHLGFLPVFTYDVIMGLIAMIAKGMEEGAEILFETGSVFLGGNFPWVKPLRNVGKGVINGDIDEISDVFE